MSDLIDRQMVIDAIQKHYCNTQRIIDAVEALPSAQLEKRTDKRTETHACDCISRQEALDTARADLDGGTPYDIPGKIERLPSAQSEQRWIPTSEHQPKVREWVLCQCRAGIMDVLRLTEDGTWNKNYPHAEYLSGFVIAWMPLPKPYREGEHNG